MDASSETLKDSIQTDVTVGTRKVNRSSVWENEEGTGALKWRIE